MCGLFLMGDYQAFSDLINQQVAMGNPEFTLLLPVARRWLGRSHANVLRKYLKQAESGGESNFYADGMVFEAGGMILERGASLGEDLPAVREAGRRWLASGKRGTYWRLDKVQDERFRKLLGIE